MLKLCRFICCNVLLTEPAGGEIFMAVLDSEFLPVQSDLDLAVLPFYFSLFLFSATRNSHISLNEPHVLIVRLVFYFLSSLSVTLKHQISSTSEKGKVCVLPIV